MATDNTETNDEQNHNLRVSPDTIISGLKINDRPGEQRTVLFRKQVGGGRADGTLRDVRGMHWDGDAPIQLRPQTFTKDDVESPAEARSLARRIAEKEGGDAEEAVEIAMEIWEDHYRNRLKEQIVIPPRFPGETKTVYNVTYKNE